MKKVNKKITLLIYFVLVSLIIISIIYIVREFYWKKEAVEETKIVDTIEVDESKVTKESTKRMILLTSSIVLPFCTPSFKTKISLF